MKKITNTIGCLAVLLACPSCNNNPAVQTSDESKTATSAPITDSINELTDFKFHVLIANIPSPLEIVDRLPKAGLAFDKNVLNPAENESNYLTSFKRALNYGVFTVDLAYLSGNGQYFHIRKYYTVAHNLAKAIDASEGFDKIAGSRIQNNMQNKDTITRIVDEIYTATDNYLRSNERMLTATQIFTGSWVESQYITLSVIKNVEQNKNNEALFNKIFEQKLHLMHLVELLKEYENDKEFKPLIDEIKEVYKMYADMKTSDIGNKDFINNLSVKISSIRNKVTS